MRRPGPITGRQQSGVMLAADNEKSALNKKAGTDAIALASSHLLDRDIIDEDGASPKDNPLAVDDTLVEAITTGVVDDDAPKKKNQQLERMRHPPSSPFTPCLETVTPLMAEEEDEPKKNPLTPPGLGRCQPHIKPL